MWTYRLVIIFLELSMYLCSSIVMLLDCFCLFGSAIHAQNSQDFSIHCVILHCLWQYYYIYFTVYLLFNHLNSDTEPLTIS